jgi:hypothetical protein
MSVGDTSRSGTFLLAPHLRIDLPEARTIVSFGPTGRSTHTEIVVRGVNRSARVIVEPWRGDVTLEQ